MKKNLKWVLFGLILLISILIIGIKISTLNHSNQKEIEEDVIFKEEAFAARASSRARVSVKYSS